MSQGAARSRRSLIVAQAALVWADASADQLQKFVETGELESSGSSDVERVADPDGAIIRAIVDSGKLV